MTKQYPEEGWKEEPRRAWGMSKACMEHMSKACMGYELSKAGKEYEQGVHGVCYSISSCTVG